MRKVSVLVGVALVAEVLAGGCAASPSSAPGPSRIEASDERPVDGGAIVYGYEADPNGLSSVANAWDQSGLLVANALFDTLAAYDTAGNPQPYLAESFEH